MVGADKRRNLHPARPLECQTTGQLNSLVGAEGIPVDHFQGSIEHGVIDHLPDESGFCVLLQPIQDESCRVGVNIPGAFPTSYRRPGFDGRQHQHGKAVLRNIADDLKETVGAWLQHVQFNERARLQIIEGQFNACRGVRLQTSSHRVSGRARNRTRRLPGFPEFPLFPGPADLVVSL